jgi:pimeloyl-ACP methyl ester carboxylesterase
MTFSHHMASINGIQMHYVIGGHGDPVVLLHGWPETWYEWHKVMPALAKNYTVITPQALAQNVIGMIVPNSSHWIPEERPDFVIKMLDNFFAGNSAKNSK